MTATQLIEAAESNQENPEVSQMYAQISVAQSLITLTDQVRDLLSRLERFDDHLQALTVK